MSATLSAADAPPADVLQAGFLLPPLGYAVVMVRRTMASPPALGALARALAPQLVAQALVVAGLFAWPELVHWADDATVEAAPAMSERDAERLIEEMRHGR